MRTVENESMSHAKGEVVNELVVVEIKLVWQNILLDCNSTGKLG